MTERGVETLSWDYWEKRKVAMCAKCEVIDLRKNVHTFFDEDKSGDDVAKKKKGR